MREHVLAELPDATVLARAPGRVNLIGEHTDYNGFPVLPMAIDRGIWIAAAPREKPELVVRNVDPERYGMEAIPLADVGGRTRRGTWVDYVVAAAHHRPQSRGVELVVGGDLPAEAGLSSSSALVVAAFLALGEVGDRADLAEEARVAERYVGTLSGGMDQAISLLGLAGHALRIGFRPLQAVPVAMPADIAVVVAHSGVHAAKSGAAGAAYNGRVRECLTAARELGVGPDGLLADVPSGRRAGVATLGDPLLRQRADFVFREAARVDEAVVALQNADLEGLGALLNESHAGLRDDYQVSHPLVDHLADRALAAGAAGARVVGAGFGGCVVAVCAVDTADQVCAALGPQAWRFSAAPGAERIEL